MAKILGRIHNKGCVLILDFDGVLSPLVNIPSDARISRSARLALEICADRIPVAVITGRALSDIKKRVGLPKLVYAGSHGLEWEMRGRVHRRNISRKAQLVFATARRALVRYSKKIPALFVENRRYGFALGYRSLSKKQAAQFRQSATEILDTVAQARSLRAIDNLYTFEIMPMSGWTKGDCAQHIFKAVAKKGSIAVYIGDTLTDEDSFRAFSHSGITIRVGKSSTSAAQYYFKSRSRVDAFLTKIARHG